jgi:hypothetical protein
LPSVAELIRQRDQKEAGTAESFSDDKLVPLDLASLADRLNPLYSFPNVHLLGRTRGRPLLIDPQSTAAAQDVDMNDEMMRTTTVSRYDCHPTLSYIVYGTSNNSFQLLGTDPIDPSGVFND